MALGTGASAKKLSSLDGVRVVVVEDDEDSRELLGEFLLGEGADVVTAGDAVEGMAALARFKPAILLSDIGLPGEDGYALMRRCLALPEGERPSSAIAITAFCRSEDKAKSRAAGFDEHLCKPLDLNELVATMLRLLAR